jgi:hypothetical protein
MEPETGIEPVTSSLGSWQQRFAVCGIKRLEWGPPRAECDTSGTH